MTPERWQQVEELLQAALDRAPGERTAFLAASCAGDDELRREVESLLACEGQAEQLAETPPADLAAGLLAEGQAMAGRTLGHYRLAVLLGAGGMGQVYHARDLRLDRNVAIKILPEHLANNVEALRRFEREAKAIAALSHPNILAIHDFGIEQGVSYAVMELLEGETLRSRLTRAALPWREAVEIAAAVAEGLAAAHAKGIIHRDLKPENIFLTANGQVKILDFGIARVKRVVSPEAESLISTQTETTRPGAVIGTISYMSPEQVRGEEADAPSDIFALGSVLYEMVSGERPFQRETTAETIAAILKETPPALTRTGKRVPQELEHMIQHCLAKGASERPQSEHDLALDLRAISSLNERSLAPWRPRIGPAAWIGTLVLMAIVGLVVWLYRGGWREPAIDSIAVLPLVNAGGGEEAEYLSDGITEAVINNLSQLPQLKRVIARGTVFTYNGKEVDPRKVGQELNVRAVFTGRLVQRGTTLNIQADLVNVATGAQLWGDSYRRQLSDVLLLEDEIARQISEKLRLKLTGEQQQRLTKRYTENIEAHYLYLKGRHHWNKFTEEGLKESIKYFNQALDRDLNYALANVGLADAYYSLSSMYLPPSEAMPKSQAAAMRALQIDENLAEAHAALAVVRIFYDWDWAQGEQAFRRAIALNPSYASAHNLYGNFLVYMNRLDEAQVEMNRACELDPLSPFNDVGAAWPVLFRRQYDEAIEQLKKIIALNPDFPNAHTSLAWAYAFKGMYDEAAAAINKARSLDDSWANLALQGEIFGMAGKRDEARTVLAKLQDRAVRAHVAESGFAWVYAGLGEKEKALASLEKGYQSRDEQMLMIGIYPGFDRLRSEPRFVNILRSMRFPE